MSICVIYVLSNSTRRGTWGGHMFACETSSPTSDQGDECSLPIPMKTHNKRSKVVLPGSVFTEGFRGFSRQDNTT